MGVLDKLVSRSILRKYHDTVVRPTQSSVFTISQALSNFVGVDEVATQTTNGLMSAEDKSKIDGLSNPPEVVNNLYRTTEGGTLDARQGKSLNEALDDLSNAIAYVNDVMGISGGEEIVINDPDGGSHTETSPIEIYPVAKRNLSSGDYIILQGYESAHDAHAGKLYKVIADVQIGSRMDLGTHLQEIHLADEVKSVLLALANRVTGVKGSAESSYRTGAVNITAANIGVEAGAQKNTITGVKGNSESSYRTGNVNITAANIGVEAGAQKNTITGVKGNAESSYRTGNVNITAANIGALREITLSGNSYKGMGRSDGTDNGWIRTTQEGLLPYSQNDATACHIGASTWPFRAVYGTSILGKNTIKNGLINLAEGIAWSVSSAIAYNGTFTVPSTAKDVIVWVQFQTNKNGVTIYLPATSSNIPICSGFYYSDKYYMCVGVTYNASRVVALSSSWTRYNYNGTIYQASDCKFWVYYR